MLLPMELIDGERHMTVAEAAEHLGVIQETVRKWVRHKKLAAKRVGQQYFIREVDAEALRKQRGPGR